MGTVAVGTEKGGYLLTSAGDDWTVSGPLFPGWKVTAWHRTAEGTTLAALASNWFGSSIHRSRDLEQWEQVVEGPAYDPDSGRKLNQVWTFHTAQSGVFAGVDEAGLFRSTDDGETWHPVAALNDHSSRSSWVPGLGGLCAHHILSDGDRIFVAISAVGVFRSDDGGETFTRHDEGVQPAVTDQEETGYCVHSIVADPDDSDRLWRQDHRGVYRSTDGGDSWERIEEGLPASFGFPIVRDHATGRLFVVPLHSDENRLPVDGRFRIYMSTDDGSSWQPAGSGWSEHQQFTGVLRGSMAADQAGGIYAGTTAGGVVASFDAGDSWQTLPVTLPRILSVDVLG